MTLRPYRPHGLHPVARAFPRALPTQSDAPRRGATPGRDRVQLAASDVPDATPVVRHPCGVDPEAAAHWPWAVTADTAAALRAKAGAR